MKNLEVHNLSKMIWESF